MGCENDLWGINNVDGLTLFPASWSAPRFADGSNWEKGATLGGVAFGTSAADLSVASKPSPSGASVPTPQSFMPPNVN